MIIRWSDHKAGFVRRQNFLIRRQILLNPVYSVAVAAPLPTPVVPGTPGPVRILTAWAADHPWIMPDLTVTQRARVWINRVTGFEARLGGIESELDAIDALLVTIQENIATNATNIAINAAAIVAINVNIAAIEARLDALEASGIVPTNVDYQVKVNDKIINCSGSITITLPDNAVAVREVTITSIAGTVTVVGDAPIQTTSVSTGTSITLYPVRGEWFDK